MYVYIWIDRKICMYMYVHDVYTASVLSFLLGGNNFQSQVLKRGFQKKMAVMGDLKSFCYAEYLPGGLLYSLSKKRLFKIKYVLEFSIPNVDLGLF